MRKKALIALAFAGGLANTFSFTPGIAQNTAKPMDNGPAKHLPQMQNIPEVQALFLLIFANSLLSGSRVEQAEKQYTAASADVSDAWIPRNRPSLYFSFAEQVSSESIKEQSALDKKATKLADQKIEEALSRLENATDAVGKLDLLYAASCLDKQLGNAKRAKSNEDKVDAIIANCENGKNVLDPWQASAAISVLDARAFKIIPIHISDFEPLTNIRQATYTDEQVQEAEKYKLRALAIADRLPTTEHVRRKAHRDMTFWYRILDKPVQGELQMQEVFNLTGSTDEDILNPSKGSSGELVWWTIAGAPKGRL